MVYGVMIFITHIDKFFHNSPGDQTPGHSSFYIMGKFFYPFSWIL